MAGITLKNVVKTYDNGVTVVPGMDLEIRDKEFIILVGPSGCGKSTTLRMIAGLEDVTSGELYIGDRLVNRVEPRDRDIAMVFQSYALYPHMTVYKNMAFALRLRKTPASIVDKKVREAARILNIEPYLERRPKALSGGQRQRVALGRAMVRDPAVFLLDEPLSNLDAKLRAEMRSQISQLHKRLQTTFVYVTHDQTEAMTMADRIVVLKDGVIQQLDTPQKLYDEPANMFVAGFIGSPQMNFLRARVSREKKTYTLQWGDCILPASLPALERYVGREIVMGIRPEDIHDAASLPVSRQAAAVPFAAQVEIAERMGPEINLHLEAHGQKLIARVSSQAQMQEGEHVRLAVDAGRLHLFDPDTEMRITQV